MIVSGAITALIVAEGILSVPRQELNCQGISECIGAAFGQVLGEFIITVFLVGLVFLLFVAAAWFLTGMFAGWLAVHHIRRLEPGITNGQGWRVSTGWGAEPLSLRSL